METSNTFSIKRIALLMQRHLFYNLKTYLLGLAVIGSLVIISSIWDTAVSGGQLSKDIIVHWGEVLLFWGGILLTSSIFKELSSKHRGWLYMMLPANPSEKILSYWLLTSIGYALIASLTMILLSIIISIFSTLIFKSAFYIFNPFTAEYLSAIINYCIVQSLFFLGAIYFKKNNFIKTILSICVFVFTLGVIAIAIIYLLFGVTSIDSGNFALVDDHFFTVLIPSVAKVIYSGFMVPFFLTVSYFKFKEKEA